MYSIKGDLLVARDVEVSRQLSALGGKQANIYILDGSVDFTTAEPAQTAGEVYNNTTTGNGSITTGTTYTANRLYMSDGAKWNELIPVMGWLVILDGALLRFDGSTWVPAVNVPPTGITIPIPLAAVDGAALPDGEVAGKSYIVQKSPVDDTPISLGGSNPITVSHGDLIVVAAGVAASTDDGADFVVFDGSDSISSIQVGSKPVERGAVVIPVAADGVEGVVDLATLKAYESSFLIADWAASGGLSTITIAAATHGKLAVNSVQIFEGTGLVQLHALSVSGLDVTLTVTEGAEFDGKAVID